MNAGAATTFPAPGLVGRTASGTWSWTERDVLLYALGVGAGQTDPFRELELTTENSEVGELRVIPTFGVLVTQNWIGIGAREADPSMLVHAEQALRLPGPLPVAGTAHVTARVVEVLDKRSGALVVTEAHAADTNTGQELLSTRSAVFVRGAGGFGGPRRSTAAPLPPLPERSPDEVFHVSTRPDQALLYRLSGDRNPLHSDPRFAERAGFRRPILHGLCTFGITGRVLFHELCDTQPARFRGLEGRFTAPVLPGAKLMIKLWDERGGEVRFRTETTDGEIVLDRGRVDFSR